MKTTRIEAGIVVAFQDGEHKILRDGVIIMRGDTIVHVGSGWEGEVDEVVDAKNKVITPGFITTHLHSAESPLDKSWIEDVGDRQFSYSGLSEMLPARSGAISPGAAEYCARYSMIELLKTGTTTIMEQGHAPRDVLKAAQSAGIRAYIAGSFRSGRWLTSDGRKMTYEWSEDLGAAAYERALSFLEEIEGLDDERLRGFLAPAQVDTITEELLVAAKKVSDDRGLPITLHTSQSVFEFDEIVQRHGKTPVEWLHDIGFLGPRTLLGHGIYLSGFSWVQFKGRDLELLAETGSSVAHSPWVFARRGIAMESFPSYQQAGVNMTLGTDTAPQSMIEAMRWAAVLGKVTSRDTNLATAGDVFNAATINAADFLGRPDLGRIASGAKADLVFWSLDSLFMTPVRDVVKNIVYSATPGEISRVIVNGKTVLEEGVVLGIDEASTIDGLQAYADEMWGQISESDWKGRTADEMSPPTFTDFK
ncbi:MAG: amidohydrolase family protein [Leucobacter sp.]